MKVIRKYLLLEIYPQKVDDTKFAKISYGDVDYIKGSPNSVFDTEDEAITEAFNRSSYAHYIIVPQITFKTSYET